MPLPNGLPSDAWMDARVEAYIDDLLPADERSKFQARLRTAPYWQEQVKCARSIRGILKTQQFPSAPSELTDTILRHVATSARTPPEG